MGIQATASKTGLFLVCPRPFDPELEVELEPSSDAARYGSAFHDIAASCLRSKSKVVPLEKTARYAKVVDRAVERHEIVPCAQELAGHVKSSMGWLRKWLVAQKLEIVQVERAYAIKPRGDGTYSVREIDAHDDNHKYAVEEGEVPGTVDLVARNASRSRALVIDHKTGLEEDWYVEGASFAQPVKLAQMRTLGLVATRAAEAYIQVNANCTTEVGIFHADRFGLPAIYTDEYEPSEKAQHARALHWALSLLKSGFLRPGEQCMRCPVNATCPAYAARLISHGTEALVRTANTFGLEPIDPKELLAMPDPNPDENAVEVSLEERAAVLYELLKKFSVIAKAGNEEIKRMIRKGAVVETSDGKVLAIRHQTYETLSKKSVLEAMGAVGGAREIERLRKKGAIKESTREMLVADK